ncbi:hypothetical protein PROFUN_10439 [Planoprotostelium fungivorum]|uniref:Ras guanine nucleotide exchange factor n=1 Tax=Planoprotostelium fungivorum TaxID=1890364 RepID=A0A2P6NDX7_9EUKA|nr:hypothetical protein PROFUN_10439 [Planoprotostelium fungivorum]
MPLGVRTTSISRSSVHQSIQNADSPKGSDIDGRNMNKKELKDTLKKEKEEKKEKEKKEKEEKKEEDKRIKEEDKRVKEERKERKRSESRAEEPSPRLFQLIRGGSFIKRPTPPDLAPSISRSESIIGSTIDSPIRSRRASTSAPTSPQPSPSQTSHGDLSATNISPTASPNVGRRMVHSASKIRLEAGEKIRKELKASLAVVDKEDKKEKKEKKEKKASLFDSISKRMNRRSMAVDEDMIKQMKDENALRTPDPTPPPTPVMERQSSQNGNSTSIFVPGNQEEPPPDANFLAKITRGRALTIAYPGVHNASIEDKPKQMMFRGKTSRAGLFSSVPDILRLLKQEVGRKPPEISSPTTKRKTELSVTSTVPLAIQERLRGGNQASKSLRRTQSLPCSMSLSEQNEILKRIVWAAQGRPDHLSNLTDGLLVEIASKLSFLDLCSLLSVSQRIRGIAKNQKLWIHLLASHDQKTMKPEKGLPYWEEMRVPTIEEPEEVATQNGENALSLNQLVFRLTPGASALVDSDDYGAFLATYKSFTTPQSLIRKLVHRYHVPYPQKDASYVAEWKRIIQKPIQLRVCRIFKTIIEEHFDDITNDPPLYTYAKMFVRAMIAQGDVYGKSILSSFGKVRTQLPLIKLDESLSPNTRKAVKTGRIWLSGSDASTDLLEYKMEALAEQLTLLEHEIFRDVKPEEFTAIDKNKTEGNSGMTAMITHFNKISRWVQEEILLEEKLKARARKIEKLIKLAHHLWELNNFETLMAVVSAMNDTPIHRLNLTKAEVAPTSLKQLDDLAALMSAEKSFSEYRKAIKSVIENAQPCIPYIGVYRRDVIYHEEGQKSEAGINFGKSRQIYSIMQDIRGFQMNQYQLRVHPSLNMRLRNMPPLPPNTTHEEYKKNVLWGLSQLRETRAGNRASIMLAKNAHSSLELIAAPKGSQLLPLQSTSDP